MVAKVDCNNLWSTATIREEFMVSKKQQMFTAVAASILLGIGLATVPASAKSVSHKEPSAQSAQASAKEKKPAKKTAKKETAKKGSPESGSK
jgi:hypothetical protein